MSYIVRLGPQYFPDSSRNRPIRYGRIYVGEADTDPTVTANQQTITALLEDGSEVSLSQPILTSAGGIPVYNGSPITMKVPNRYSLSVLNESGSLEYYIANNFAADDWEITIEADSLQAEDGIEIPVNDDGLDCDFRVESTLETCAFFMRASDSNFGFNTCDIEAWQSDHTALQIGETATIMADTTATAGNQIHMLYNAYLDSGGWKRQYTDFASQYYQYQGTHLFNTAVSGAGDSSISFVNLLSLSGSNTVFNETGADIDFRIETSLDSSAFNIDGGTGEISFSNTNELLTLESDSVTVNIFSNDIDFLVNSTVATAFFVRASDGNIGFNNTSLSDWDSNYISLQIGGNAAIAAGTAQSVTNQINIVQNAYYDSISGWTYQYGDDTASRYWQYDGRHIFQAGPYGTAGNSISWVNYITFGETDTIFNEDGDDVNFRIESDTNANAFFLEGSSGNFGIGMNDFGSGDGGTIAIVSSTAPSGDPIGGGFLYVDDSDDFLKFRDVNGDVTQIAPNGSYYSHGSVASGTVTPDYTDGDVQYINATGSFTLANPTNVPSSPSNILTIIIDKNNYGDYVTIGTDYAPVKDLGYRQIIIKLLYASGSIVKAWQENIDEGVAKIWPDSWTERTTSLVPDSPSAGDYFGTAISLSSDGNVLAVGAQYYSSGAGCVYIYDLINGSWVERSIVTASDAGANDYFGASCALSGNGSVLAVGAYAWDGGALEQGAAYVFDWNGITWTERTTALTPSDAGLNDFFGYSIGISYDGSIMAVGAYSWDGGAGTDQGAVYIFDWDGSTWNQRVTTLTPSDAGGNDRFGSSIAFSVDGKILAVGAILWDGGAGADQGAMYVFDWDGDGWNERTTALTASDASGSDFFGSSCALSDDGSIMAVGAYNWDGGAGTDQGAAYVFDWTGSTWTERTTALTPSDAGTDNFGKSISLSGDGSILAVGSQLWDGGAGADQGAAYIYDLDDYIGSTTPIFPPSTAKLPTGDIVFNEAGADYDFRIESDTRTHAFFLEGSSGNIGLGASTLDTHNTDYVGLQIGETQTILGDLDGSNADLFLLQNAYYTSSPSYIYQSDDYASWIQLTGQYIAFFNANYGTTGNTIIDFFQTFSTSYTGAVFNEGGNDYDFRIETSLDANAFTVDGGTGVISFSNTNDLLSFDAAETVFNDSGADIDFRVESDTNANAFFIEGSSSNVGFNNGSLETWYSLYTNIKLGETGNIAFNTTDTAVKYLNITQNAYLNASAQWIYQFTNDANLYLQGEAGHTFYSAISGTAGNPISWIEQLTLKIGELVINEGSADIDFRVESDTLTHALFVEGSSGNIGIGTGSLSSWDSSLSVAQLNSNFSVFGSVNIGGILENVYNDGSWRYQTTNAATMVLYEPGIFNVNTATIGTVDTAITFVNRFQVDTAETVFNDFGNDIDFRIESDTNTHAFFVDGATGVKSLSQSFIENWFVSTYDVLQVGSDASIIANRSPGSTNYLLLTQNGWIESGTGDWKKQDDGLSTLQYSNQGIHSFNTSVTGLADSAITWIDQLQLKPTEAVFNDGGADIDFRVESDTITNAIFMDGATGIVSLPACYSHDMNGETYRDLLINDSGELGYDSSTIRKKTNVVDMEDVSWLYDLRPVNFEFKRRNPDGQYYNEGTGIKKYGLIAEELESVNSDFVFYEDGLPEGVHYREFIPVLIKALQDQNDEICSLRSRLDELQPTLH